MRTKSWLQGPGSTLRKQAAGIPMCDWPRNTTALPQVTDLERGPHADEDPDIDSHKYSVKDFF